MLKFKKNRKPVIHSFYHPVLIKIKRCWLVNQVFFLKIPLTTKLTIKTVFFYPCHRGSKIRIPYYWWCEDSILSVRHNIGKWDQTAKCWMRIFEARSEDGNKQWQQCSVVVDQFTYKERSTNEWPGKNIALKKNSHQLHDFVGHTHGLHCSQLVLLLNVLIGYIIIFNRQFKSCLVVACKKGNFDPQFKYHTISGRVPVTLLI